MLASLPRLNKSNSSQDPVTIMVQLPVYPDKPEWKCDGSTLPLEDVPLTALIGTLRDRIQVSNPHGDMVS